MLRRLLSCRIKALLNNSITEKGRIIRPFLSSVKNFILFVMRLTILQLIHIILREHHEYLPEAYSFHKSLRMENII